MSEFYKLLILKANYHRGIMFSLGLYLSRFFIPIVPFYHFWLLFGYNLS